MEQVADARDLLIDATPEDLARIRERYNPLAWVSEFARIRLPKGGITIDGFPRQLDFNEHPFLRDLYLDTSPEIVVIKGAQLGFSTWAINRALWMATTFACTVIYTFPTREDVQDFTATRINPIITDTPFLAERIVDVDSVKVKKFARNPRRTHPGENEDTGTSTIHFRGAANDKDAISVDADMLIHDEEDKSNPTVISQYISRTEHSKWKRRIRLSTPTYPNAGIDVAFKQSDKRRWLVKCAGCGTEFTLRWPRYEGDPRGNIEPYKWEEIEELSVHPRFKCHRCGHTITTEDRVAGRWVPSYADKTRPHGYSLSQMSAPWITAETLLWRRKNIAREQDFWNLNLGEAWDDAANSITKDAIIKRATGGPQQPSAFGCYMGVDVGRKMDIQIHGLDEMGRPRLVRMARVDEWAEVDMLMDLYDVVTCVVDWQPDERGARDFAARHNTSMHRRVWRCRYRTYTNAATYLITKWDDETGMVLPPRTETIDNYVHDLLTVMVLPEYNSEPDYQVLIAHHTNSKRRPIYQPGMEKEQMIDHYEWFEIGADHLFHAGVYATLARNAPRSAPTPMKGIVGISRAELHGSLAASVQRQLTGDSLPPRIQRIG